MNNIAAVAQMFYENPNIKLTEAVTLFRQTKPDAKITDRAISSYFYFTRAILDEFQLLPTNTITMAKKTSPPLKESAQKLKDISQKYSLSLLTLLVIYEEVSTIDPNSLTAIRELADLL